MITRHYTKKIILPFCLFFFGLYSTLAVSAQNKEILSIAFLKYPYTLNFIESYNHSEYILHSTIYSSLLTINTSTLQPEVGIAVSWFVNESQDVFIFNIRKNARFSDGSLITAQDVRDSWLASIKSHNAYTYLFELIAGVSEYINGEGSLDDIQVIATKDNVLKVVLREPAPYFLSTIVHPAFSISSSEQVQKKDWDANPTDIIFSGPYVIHSKSDDYLELKKNEYFWAKDAVFFEYVTIKFYDYNNENNIFEDIKNNDIQWSTFYAEPKIDISEDDEKNTDLAPIDELKQALKEPTLKESNTNDTTETEATAKTSTPEDFGLDEDWIQVYQIFGSEYLFFNDTQNKPWDNPQVRKALRMLLPLDDFLQENYRFPAYNLVPPISGIYEPTIHTIFQDAELAHSILEKEGYPKGVGLGDIVLLATEYQDGGHAKIFDFIKENIEKELDVNVQIKKVSAMEYQDAIEHTDYTLGLTGWIGDFADPSAFLQIWSSPNPKMGHNYNDSEYQKLISKSNLETDDARTNTLKEAEILLLNSATVIPLRRLITTNIVRTDLISGWNPNILDAHLIGGMYKKKSSPIYRLTSFEQKRSKVQN